MVLVNENIKRLVEAIGNNLYSVREMLVAVGLKDRPNFIEYTLTPAVSEGYVCMIYPETPKHPKQKYRLTEKGKALLNGDKGKL